MRCVNDAKRVRAICELIETVRLGDWARTWREATAALRSLLDTEQVWMFQFELRNTWTVSRSVATGQPDGFTQVFSNALATSPGEWAWFKPSCPDPAQRNRVVESLSAASKESPGYFEASRVYRDAMYPHRLHRHRQLRVLICDRDRLLGWFGAIQPDEPTQRQHAILRALVPSVHRRMLAEHRLEAIPDLDRALDVALDHLESPAWLLERERVVHANQAARGQAVEGVRIPVDGSRGLDLVIGRGRTSSSDKIAAVATAWKLSARTAEVLRHVIGGHANATIAQLLGISTRAVELHITKLLDHAGVDGRAALIARVLEVPTAREQNV